MIHSAILTGVQWRRLLFWILAGVLFVNVGRIAFRRLVPVRAGASVPYTVVRTETGYNNAGVLRYTIQYTEAARSDGSTMRRVITPVIQQRRIYVANGPKILMNESLARKSTFPHFFKGIPGSAEGAREPEASCLSATDKRLGWVLDGTETIANFRVVRIKLTGSPRQITAWHALDAGCAEVQLRMLDEAGNVSVQNLTSLTIGEPDPRLFEAPAEFQEVPTSKLYESVCPGGGDCKSLPESVQKRMDDRYQAAQTNIQ